MADLLLGGLIGIFFGLGIGFIIGSEREPCEHEFEEVLNTINHGKHIVVHMCKKCGKRKITKV